MGRIMRLLVALAVQAAALFGLGGTASAAPPTLDGMVIGHLPAGLGTSTDFDYEYDDVAFVARTWESRTSDGWQVDADIAVLRGARLTTPRALHDWYVAYEDRPAGEADYRPTSVRGHRGWRSADKIFWLARPGLAVTVYLDTDRWSRRELVRTARSVREAR